MGENKDFFLIEDITNLVEKIRKKYHIGSIVTIGSSKGVTSALFYGLLINAEYIVAGAPQYYIGDYLSGDKHRPILQKIMGDTSTDSITELNTLLYKQIKKSTNSDVKRIYLLYSPSEHAYSEHVQYLIEDLKNNGFEVSEDCGYSYENHSDVAKFFPQYLHSVLCDLFPLSG